MTFDPSTLDWSTGKLAGWTYDKPVNKWFQGSFRAAHRLVRQCPTCADFIVLDVTTKALQGDATNHGLSLRRCKKCREALKHAPAEYAERKAQGAEARTETATQPFAGAEIERLRTENRNLRDEVAGHLSYIAELRAELALYKPPSAQEVLGQSQKVTTNPSGLHSTLPWA